MANVNYSLATKCMDFCHALTSQKKSFNFSLTIGSNYTFSLDTKENLPSASKAVRKKSPSAIRRNARRRTEFLKKKFQLLSSSTVNEVAADIISLLVGKLSAPSSARQSLLLHPPHQRLVHQLLPPRNWNTPPSLTEEPGPKFSNARRAGLIVTVIITILI